MFSRQTYIHRRDTLQNKLGTGLALFLGNDESPMNYAGNTYHFRQDSSFLYFFGVDRPGLSAIVDFDDGATTVYGDELTIDQIVWMGGGGPTIAESAAQAGIEKTAPAASLARALAVAMKKKRKIHFLPPYRPENRLKLLKLLQVIPDDIAARASLELIKAVADQRIVKSDEEIVEIEKAVTLSAEMHCAAMRMVHPGLTEAAVAAEVARVALASGGQLAFPIIATVNGQILHNHYHGNILKSRQLFLLDAGAETAMHYAGDLTTIMPVDNKFTERQKDVYAICLAAHRKAVSMLRPEINFKEVHRAACTVIARGMKDLGLMKGPVDDAVAAGAHALFMPHGIGHLLGLDVHDMEDLGEKVVGHGGKTKNSQFGLKYLRLGRELRAGFVLTIEPGIYFIPELRDKWKKENLHARYLDFDKMDKYMDFGGIRNEENYVITADGARLLGNYVPRTVEEIEKEREKAF